MRGIYLASFKAYHPGYNIIYQDINGLREIGGDMIDIIDSDLIHHFDFVIATPPCNWWSRANWRRNVSEYSLKTKHLLIDTLTRLSKFRVPVIIENVRNDKFFKEYGLFDLGYYVYRIGRHTYWTNFEFECLDINQVALTDYKNGKKRYLSSQNLPRYLRQGTKEVHEVIERWLNQVVYEFKRKENRN